MLKVAVIGVGAMGRHHARNYHDIPDVDLVAVSDTNPKQSESIGNTYGVPFETDYLKLLDDHKPDLVSISVPTNLHFEIAKSAIERGIHVLVEKPITETVKQAKELIQLADEKGVKLTVGHIERFNPAIIELKKHLEEDRLGQVFRIQSRRMGPFPARIRDVGVVIDLATHDLDMVRYVLNTDITRVFAETAHGINTDREDIMDCVLRTTNGTIGTLNINWMTPTKVRELTIIGAKGMYLVNYLTQDLYFYENDAVAGNWSSLDVLRGVGEGNVTQFKLSRQEPLRAQLMTFVQAVAEDKPPLVSGSDGLKALAWAQATVKSGLEGIPVTSVDI